MSCYVCDQLCEPFADSGGAKYRLPFKAEPMTMHEKAAWFDVYRERPGSIVDVHLDCVPHLDRLEKRYREAVEENRRHR